METALSGKKLSCKKVAKIKVNNNMNTTIIYFLDLARGKKTTIGLIIALINTYLLTIGVYGNNEAVLVNGILLALGLTTNVADYKLLAKRKKVNSVLENK